MNKQITHHLHKIIEEENQHINRLLELMGRQEVLTTISD